MGNDPLKQSRFSLHGLGLELRTNSGWIQSALEDLLRHFLAEEPKDAPEVTISLFDRETPTPSWCAMPAEPVLHYAASPEDRLDIRQLGLDTLKIYGNSDGNLFCADFGELGSVSYRLDLGAAHGHVNRPEVLGAKAFSSNIFMLVLSHLMAAYGYFHAHCAAVEKHGRGILLPGFSGSGKTTACIALVRKGFGFLGDDRPLLRSSEDGTITLLSFPEEIDVTDNTIGLFPELKREAVFEGRLHGRKKSFEADKVFPGATVDSCIPKFILYPEVASGSKSCLETMPKNVALSTFLPHSLFVADKKTAARHFDLLYDLIASTDCYRLRFGSDVLDLPDLVETLFR